MQPMASMLLARVDQAREDLGLVSEVESGLQFQSAVVGGLGEPKNLLTIRASCAERM